MLLSVQCSGMALAPPNGLRLETFGNEWDTRREIRKKAWTFAAVGSASDCDCDCTSPLQLQTWPGRFYRLDSITSYTHQHTLKKRTQPRPVDQAQPAAGRLAEDANSGF